MAGGERPHLNRNEAAEQENLKDAQKADQTTAKLQQDGLFGKGMEKMKGTDASKEVADGGTQVTPERALLAIQRLQDAMNDPVKAQLLTGLINQSQGHFERPLLAGLHPTDDPAKMQKQKDILAMIQNVFTDSAKNA